MQVPSGRKEKQTGFVHISAIPAACAKLLSGLLGEQIDVQHQVQYQQQPQQPTAQPSQTHNAQQPRTRSGVEVVFGYLGVFPTELGTFSTEPKTVIEQINKQAMHDYDTWRLPTAEELALVRAQGLIGGGNYMTSATSASEGIVLLVTDATETYSAKQARLAKEEEKRIAEERERSICLSGKGDNGVYKIGYYYNKGGRTGIVFDITEGGRHGKIFGLVQKVAVSWDNAMRLFTGKWAGWRLPTMWELSLIYGYSERYEDPIRRTRRELGYGLWYNDYYWSCDEAGDYSLLLGEYTSAKARNLDTGNRKTEKKKQELLVLPVYEF